MTEIPTSFYIILGVMVVTNLTGIITMMTFIFKAGQFVATTDAWQVEIMVCPVRLWLEFRALERQHYILEIMTIAIPHKTILK